jgi:hypothetical protein
MGTFYVSLPVLITLLIMILSTGFSKEELLVLMGFLIFYFFFIRNKKVMAVIEQLLKPLFQI